MNAFFKYFLASLLAIFVASIIPLFLFIGFIGVISTLSETKQQTTVSPNTILKLSFDTPIVDQASDNPMDYFDFASLEVKMPLTTMSVIAAIEKASADENIQGIYLEPSVMMPIGMATLQEIRKALERFKESGKPIYSYASIYTQKSYYLASVADTLILNPQGALEWKGMSMQVPFFKETLDKLGVEAEVVKQGKFKSAVEPFILNGMSAESRLQNEQLLGSIWGDLLQTISAARGIDSVLLQQYATGLSVTNTDKALKLGFIDSLLYKNETVAFMETKFSDKFPVVSLNQYAKGIPSFSVTKNNKPSANKIALIYASGDIIDGKSAEGVVGDVTLCQQIAEARKDDAVKAIVLRVNSPGGSALAAEIIYHELKLAQEKKPLIVSMGDCAASGGYYIAAPADVIVASETTITGSIGVFGILLNAEKGLKEKLGIKVDIVRTNPSADMGTPFRALTSPEREYLQNSVEEVYDTFVDRVATGRNMSYTQVDEIGQGRVWSGVMAKKIGLVDEIGGLREAVIIAADKAGILEDFRVSVVTAPEDRVSQLIALLESTALKVMDKKDPLAEQKVAQSLTNQYNHIMNIVNGAKIQAVLPYEIELN